MRPCQLCGAKSWGPITKAEEICAGFARRFVDMPSEAAAYVRCDGCNAIAQKALIDEVEIPLSAAPPPFDPMAIAQGFLKQVMPVPETRTERLVKVLLKGSVAPRPGEPVSMEQMAREVVQFVRIVEGELDSPGSPRSPYPDRLPEFSPEYVCMTRRSFEHYLERSIQRMRETLKDKPQCFRQVSENAHLAMSELVSHLERVVNE